MKGCCKSTDEACNFAHGEKDLRQCNSISVDTTAMNVLGELEVTKSSSINSDAPTQCPSEMSYDSETERCDIAMTKELRSCLRKRASSHKKRVNFVHFVEIAFIPVEGRGLSMSVSKGKRSNDALVASLSPKLGGYNF